MPLTYSTRDVIFINTSPPEKRTFLLKDKVELDQLPENSTDIAVDNMIKRYSKRPRQLEQWCLADVTSKLEVKFPEEYAKISEENETNDDNNDSENDETNDSETFDVNFSDTNTIVTFKNGIEIRRRKTQYKIQ